MKEEEEEVPGAVDVSGRKSKVLGRWIQDPRADRDLASRVLREMQTRVEVHVGRDFTLDVEEMLNTKGNMKEVEEEWPGAVDVSWRKSVVLERWIQDPRVDRDLARRLLREVQSRVEVQIGMDYTMEMEEMLGEKRLG